VYAAYVAHSRRAPDARARDRARLFAELEFASWLVHGHETGRPEVIDDAVGLLETLSTGVADDDIVTDAALDVDDAIALLDRMPEAAAAVIDTSMHTDAYDPEELSSWVSADDSEDDAPSDPRAADLGETAEIEFDQAAGTAWRADDTSTSPIDIADVRAAKQAQHQRGIDGDADDRDAVADAERASEAALRRWLAE
jgi:hypothetical protein